jgi:hypothetical protein
MKTLRLLAATAALALASVAGADAAQILATAPALAAYPTTQTMICSIVNIDKVQRNVTIEVMDYFGNVVSGPLSAPFVPFFAGYQADISGGNGTWCRFTVDGSAKKFRAVAAYADGTKYTVANPAK